MKTVITCGCSFSDTAWRKTWPHWLAKYFPDAEHVSAGLSAAGNGYISRTAIYHVTQALKRFAPEQILVGVMWSGRDRHEVYLGQPPEFAKNDGWRQNPTKFVTDNQADNNWIMLNWYWDNDFAKQYFSRYHDNTGSQIYAIEHVLRTQWFLELHGIPY